MTYNGSAQALVTAPTGYTGNVYYAVTTTNSKPSSGFSTSIPTGTNAGTYYVWYYSASGTNYNQSSTGGAVTVTIAKKAGSVTLSASSGSVNLGSSTTFTVKTNTSGGTLSASSSATGKATASLSGTTVTVKGVGAGSATITVTSAATTNYNAASATYTITVNKVAASVSSAPTAKTLKINGQNQVLVNAGSASGGTMYYKVVNSSGTLLQDWTNNINAVVGKAATTYTVYYYVKGDSNHTDSAQGSVSVQITGYVFRVSGEFWTRSGSYLFGTGWNAINYVNRVDYFSCDQWSYIADIYSGYDYYSEAYGPLSNWATYPTRAFYDANWNYRSGASWVNTTYCYTYIYE